MWYSIEKERPKENEKMKIKKKYNHIVHNLSHSTEFSEKFHKKNSWNCVIHILKTKKEIFKMRIGA